MPVLTLNIDTKIFAKQQGIFKYFSHKKDAYFILYRRNLPKYN